MCAVAMAARSGSYFQLNMKVNSFKSQGVISGGQKTSHIYVGE